MEEIIMFVFMASVFGFFTGQVINWIDEAMDYGKIFSSIRFNAVKRSAQKAGLKQQFEESVNDVLEMENFAERLKEMNEVYWSVALKRAQVIPWICPVCMGTRIHLLLSLVACVFFPYSFWGCLAFIALSGTVSYYFIGR